jgi:hypothetical protein
VKRREGRIVNGRPAVMVGKRTKPCPVCGAAIGWRCTWTVAGREVPRKTDHRERL